MTAALEWAAADDPPVDPPSALTSLPIANQWARGRRTHARMASLPPEVEAAIWRGTELGSPVSTTQPSGFAQLDAELPGGGWPCQSLTEILQPQPAVAEWRLLGPAMRAVVANSGQIVLIGPSRTPHLPGLRFAGIDERQLVWIKAETPAERLWVTEQFVKANASGLLVAWLPQARQEQIRRLQVCAQGCDSPVFLCRPLQAEHEPSAAPLRVKLRFGLDWELQVEIFKRKGPVNEGAIHLQSVPGGLAPLITPRIAHPSEILAARRRRELHSTSSQASRDVVGSTANDSSTERRIAH